MHAHSALTKTWTIIRLTRPIFLVGGVFMFALGTAAAFAQGYPIKLLQVILGQLLVTTTQLFAQYSNEYFDIETDRLNSGNRTWLSGGSGILPTGSISLKPVFNTIKILSLLSAAFLLLNAFFSQAPVLILLIGVTSILGSWFYSAPPLCLKGSGTGEFVSSVIVAFLVPFTGYALQTGRFEPGLLVLLSPLILVHWAMLIAFSFPDTAADRAAGIETLAVRMGLKRAAAFHNLILFGSLLLILWIADSNLPPIQFIYLWLILPLFVLQMLQIGAYARGNWRKPTLLATAAMSLFIVTSLALFTGIISF